MYVYIFTISTICTMPLQNFVFLHIVLYYVILYLEVDDCVYICVYVYI